MKFVLIFFSFLLSASLCFGQSVKNIALAVTDMEGNPLPQATAITSKSNKSAVANDKGYFHITNVIAGETITVSMIGYARKTITVGAEANVKIQLEPDNQTLDDVVVIGYGEVKRKDLTGAVGSANIKDMRKAPVASFTEALAGRVAGLQVTSTDGQPGSDLQIVLRGNNSVTQDNSPLFVIDGFPVENPDANTINPEEIESIEVLKDASATAIYGARGANGVIIITTKKGNAGPPVISYQAWVGASQNLKEQELLDPYEFVKLQIEDDPLRYTPVYLSDGKTIEDYKNIKGTNWQALVIHDGFTQNHDIAIRGGTAQTKYSISGSLFDQHGIVVNSGFNRYQGRFKLDQVINKKLKAGINVNYSSTKKYGQIISETQEGGATASLMYSLWGYRPVTGNITDDELLQQELFDPAVNPGAEFRINPLISLQNEYKPTFTRILTANVYADYDITKELALRVTGGWTHRGARREVFNNSKTRSGNPLSTTGMNGSVATTEGDNYINENTLTYNRRFGSHRLNILGGMTMQKVTSYRYGFKASHVPNEALGMSGLDEGVYEPLPSEKSSSTLMSWLGRVNYSFTSKYLLTVSFRADGSSKFPAGNKWAYFPSGSLAWRLIDESFMKGLRFLSDAKIRTGYGVTGNNRVGDFAYLSSLTYNNSSGYTFGNGEVKGIFPDNLGNSQLKWETTKQLNVGIDLGLFSNRILLTADYYRKVTSDLLLNATLAPSMGYLTGMKNVGQVSNRGIELTLNTINIEKGKFSWTTNFNIAFNKNRVDQLNKFEASMLTRIGWGSYGNAYPYIAIPGRPIALFYGFVFDGVYQFEDFNQMPDGSYFLKQEIPNNGQTRNLIQPGTIKYRDINGDGLVDDKDLTIIGNPNPVHTGGLSNTFTYGGFDLNVFFQWSYGNDILNANRLEFEGASNRSLLNQFKSYAERWTPENPTNKLYRHGGQGPLVYSSRVIEDGSFLRLKTVALGYNLPSSLLRSVKISSLRFFVSAQNLLVWTNYSGLDPEVSVKPSALSPGFDWSPYPRSRTITIGVNVSL